MDITAIAQAALALIAAIITTFLVPWIKSKTSENQFKTIESAVQFAVQAAEQLYRSGQGAQKKQYVLDYLQSKGYTVDDAVIEATVNSFFGREDTTAGEFAEVE